MDASAATAPVVAPIGLPQRLGELLVDRGLLNAADLQRALGVQAQLGGRLGQILVRLGALSEDSLLPVLAEQLGMPVLVAAEWPQDAAALRLDPALGIVADWFIDQGVVVWTDAEGRCRLAARDPLDPAVNELLEARLPPAWAWRLVRAQELERLLDAFQRANRAVADEDDDIGHLRELAEEAPVIELVNNLLAQAMDRGASDIHVEPGEDRFSVRFRVDGVLHEVLALPLSRFAAVASRIKLISGMDIAERRLPQDGRLSARVSGREVDVRASAVPGVHGESIVMRLLPKEREDLSLERLGFEPADLARFRRWATEPHGIVLVTGPTGSGKSTTLYATLESINDRAEKIITVEDPVEYQVPGITQIQANAEIGYTFARALRAILRQDPDVVMIGEIRDRETAEIAIQAALTGHLVFSTLHTNDAVSAFTRLVDMGVEPFLVATSVRAVQAQRLLRRLCGACSAPAEVLPQVAAVIAPYVPAGETPDWRRAVGCPACQGTGYRGRVGIYELVEVDAALQGMVMQRATAADMRRAADAQGGRTLRHDGLLKAFRGLTTVDEVARVTGGALDALDERDAIDAARPVEP
ncbi:MAG TPA: type II secretion system protein [Xanthomonadaceae bacterium]|jgi:general secretion pathway protein E|nr:type II secretion system protein [Xanthomonadaceae bacterium]